MIRQRITRGGGDECLFRFEPVFITAEGQIDLDSMMAAVTGVAAEVDTSRCIPPDSSVSFETARRYVEEHVGIWDWVDDVEFLGLSWVEFK